MPTAPPLTPAERKALAFVAGLAALGVAARAAGVGELPAAVLAAEATPAEDRAALVRQLEAVDSARARKGVGKKRRQARGEAPAPPLTRALPGADTPARVRAVPASSPIDADRADSAAFDALPGVGPALARRLVADRAARGPFGSIAGLSRVSGIGPRLEARLAPLVTFSSRP